ncbi:Stk1 family PASTA domain-containing Ser/Thr kinase [Paenibacillus filicis]|uniref:non-specific serine/threonine protein kinase n=1 Tax=Paenibacillus gyeongsangnamensis TaxID=3388067 RepID=A0ABT4Q3H5_9BACL|nr:Stk1 family PASTA domain-containing Ser/Thr kinase [Paenibacillus filicis]MCZ8511429.1 Stk1 family PASTA domain-containing Ser/Thr kinase [Paenibacillus filicis]
MIGKQLGGRYEVLERVGGGGMAIVYKGLDILLHRHVAVKVLRQQYVHDEEFIQRFRREAQAAASLSHPNVVSIYDVGQEEDVHYIVMEYIEGTTLNDLIKEKAPLQVEEAVHIASQICDALDHAHHNQIIHRDIKPHNILIGKNGRIKVTDFGIARAVTSSTITQTGSVVGSVHYFSPEHAKGTPTGEQSDLYSLGIVMYQMLTGRLPFLGESPISVALKHLQEDVEDPRKVNPLIPQSVENIILRAMRKSTSERYRSAKDMLNDLDSCLQPQRRNEPKIHFFDDDEMDEEKTRVMPALRPGQYTPDPRADESDDEEEDEEEPGKKNRWVKPLIWFIVLMALVGGMWYAVQYVSKSIAPPSEVLVPSVVGKTLADAQTELKGLQLVPEVAGYEASKDVPKDTVIRQDPSNMKVRANSKVKLTVSSGPQKQKMPDVTKKKLSDALALLAQLGYKEDRISVDKQYMDADPDLVMSQTPGVDEDIDPTTGTVKLTVSKGRETFKMPNLIGKTEAEARNQILASNLKLGKDAVTYESSYKQSKGRVIVQFPFQPNDDVYAGSEVSKLIVSSGLPDDAGPMTVTVPVKPAREGKPSTVKIILSDAQYDNFEYQTLNNVTKTENVDVKLVVAPDKKATIQLKVDNQITDIRTVTYQDYLAQKNGVPPGNGGKPGAGGPTTGPGTGTAPPAPGTNGGAAQSQPGGASNPAVPAGANTGSGAAAQAGGTNNTGNSTATGGRNP